MTKTKIFNNSFAQFGAGISEVLMAMAIVVLVMPLVYSQVIKAGNTITDIAVAKKIIAIRSPALNFMRLNQAEWPDTWQSQLSDEDLSTISDMPSACFIDKYTVSGATITDMYFMFDTGYDAVRTTQIAHHIGVDAAVISDDGVAYGASWAVSAPEFVAGNLIYRVSHDLAGEDKTKYLHRGTSGTDDLNTMQRDLNMGGYDLQDVGTITARVANIQNMSAEFIKSQIITARNVYYSGGANINANDTTFDNVRVTGDVSGFRSMTAQSMNDSKYTTSGSVVADRATVTGSVNVSRDLTIKSDSARTISGFAGMTAGIVLTPYIHADEMIFYGNTGLTLSGELLMSSMAPLKIGSWVFPTGTPPAFNEFILSRAQIPTMPSNKDFAPLMQDDWKSYIPKGGAL